MGSREIDRIQGGMPVSEAIDLAGLVEYGKGAVVSRTLIQAAVGTVTVFAFERTCRDLHAPGGPKIFSGLSH